MSLVATALVLELVTQLGVGGLDRYRRIKEREAWDHADHRLLVLGDSFMAPENSLVRLFTERLNQHGISVLNTAEGGYGPEEYLDTMKRIGLEYRPDTVLLSYYVGNDLTDVQYPPPRKDRIRSFAHRSVLYEFFTRRIRRRVSPLIDEAALEANGTDREFVALARAGKLNPWFLWGGLHRKNYLLDNILMETAENQEAWKNVRLMLDEIAELCDTHGMRFLVVMIPRSVQINRSHFDFWRKLTYHLDERTLDSRRPQDLMLTFCKDQNIPCLDLLPFFREERKQEFYMPQDDHLNHEGHRFVESLVSNFVLTHMGILEDHTE